MTTQFTLEKFIIISVTVSLRFGVGVGVFALNLISQLVSPSWNVDLISRRVTPGRNDIEECHTSKTRFQRSSVEYHPCANQQPKKELQILLNCMKLKFVSYTSNLLEQTYDFQKRTMFSRSGF